ncbi:hypothetical protein ABZX40_40715 [Streptomyces sp. NPDC004610]
MTETPPPDRRNESRAVLWGGLLMFLIWVAVMAYVMAVVLADEPATPHG